MGCFLVPATEAVVTHVTSKVVKSKEKDASSHISFSTKLGWLNKMLVGGSVLLAFEHVWHGEVVPFFPFLTAVKSGETAEMLAEMGTTGVLMAGIVTTVWLGMVVVSTVIEKRAANDVATAEGK